MLTKRMHRWRWSWASRRSISIMFDEYGPPERVLRLNKEEKPASPGPEECALRLLASAINPLDLNTIQGTYVSKPLLPCVPGYEGVFEVLEVGKNVSDFKAGDRVVRKGRDINNGTWQTNPVFPQEHLHKIPCDIPIALAAAMMINPPSAYLMLKDFVQLQEGDVVIQNSANSVVGQALIQIASFMKLKTINIVRDRPDLTELADFLKSLGATEVVTEEAAQGYQFKSIIEKLGKPKLALNGVGGKSSLSLLRTLDEGGLMVTYGGMSRQPVTVTTAMFVFNNIRVVGFSLVKWLQENSAQARDEVVNDVIELAQSGHLKPVMHTPWRLEDFKMAVSQAMKPRQTSKQIFLN